MFRFIFKGKRKTKNSPIYKKEHEETSDVTPFYYFSRKLPLGGGIVLSYYQNGSISAQGSYMNT